jgi:hypothetical protein
VKQFFPIWLVLILGCKPVASPTADLASPSQAKRDAAAKILRATATPPSNIKWILRTAFIKTGENKTNILEWLRSYNAGTNPVGGLGGITYSEHYQLDDYWVLGCSYKGDDNSLIQWKLEPRWRAVAVWPATNFSGVWINYYANGQKFTEGNYTNGGRSGEATTFEPDGSKSSVWHYDHDNMEGLWTQYFPSGQIQYQCQYSNNLKVGIEVRFNENGSTNSTKNYSKP